MSIVIDPKTHIHQGKLPHELDCLILICCAMELVSSCQIGSQHILVIVLLLTSLESHQSPPIVLAEEMEDGQDDNAIEVTRPVYHQHMLHHFQFQLHHVVELERR